MNRTTTNLKTYNKRMREVYERIGEIYLDQSYYGSRQMTAVWKRLGDEVNRKRVQRLLKKMCIVAIYARKRTTIRAKSYTIYPYLLKNRVIETVNQVWCSDITYFGCCEGYLFSFCGGIADL